MEWEAFDSFLEVISYSLQCKQYSAYFVSQKTMIFLRISYLASFFANSSGRGHLLEGEYRCSRSLSTSITPSLSLSLINTNCLFSSTSTWFALNIVVSHLHTMRQSAAGRHSWMMNRRRPQKCHERYNHLSIRLLTLRVAAKRLKHGLKYRRWRRCFSSGFVLLTDDGWCRPFIVSCP